MTPINPKTAILMSVIGLVLATCHGFVYAADTEGPALACPGPSLAPMFKKTPERKNQPVSVMARQFDAGKTGVAEASERVEVRRADQLLTTELLLYDQESKTLTMPGKVFYEDSVMHISGFSAEYSFLTENGSFLDVDYGLVGSSAKGSASEVTVDSGNHSVLRQLQFTTCPGESPEWLMTAKELELDFEKGMGKARGAKLRFFDIPFVYLPYMTFPINDQRKTGFLYPFISTANDNGFEFSAPFYWNIAPNHDATITPRYFTRRGFMLTGEYRMITRKTRGSVNFDYLRNDSQSDESRYHYRINHGIRINRRWRTEVVINRVSDSQYFQDFGNSLAATSIQYMRSRAGIHGSGHYWALSVIADNFQVVDESINILRLPYKRVPRIVFDVDRPLGQRGLRFQMQSELVNFDRDTGVTGARFDLYPRLEWDIGTNWGYIRPTAGYRYTTYDLDRQGLPGNTSPHRGTEIISLDTGLFFERDAGKGRVQTLEPRLFYLYVPYKDQLDIPDFDTAPFTFGFSQLFHFNRFAGADRQSEANQLTMALTTRSTDQVAGRELWSMSFGQIAYFETRRIVPDFDGGIDHDRWSPFIAEFILNPTRRLSSRVNAQWNWQTDRIDVAVLGVTHTAASGRRFGAEYRYRRDRLDQFDLRYYQPINERWLILGRVNYSLKNSDLLAAEAGFEYDSCCWGLRMVARRYLRNNDGDHRDAIYLQLVLKGLSNIGRRSKPLFYDLVD